MVLFVVVFLSLYAFACLYIFIYATLFSQSFINSLSLSVFLVLRRHACLSNTQWQRNDIYMSTILHLVATLYSVVKESKWKRNCAT